MFPDSEIAASRYNEFAVFCGDETVRYVIKRKIGYNIPNDTMAPQPHG